MPNQAQARHPGHRPGPAVGPPQRPPSGHGRIAGDAGMTEHPFLGRIRTADLVGRVGRVQRILPTYIEADGPNVPRGALCRIEVQGGPGSTPASESMPAPESMLAEVVGVNPGSIILVPFEDHARTFAGARVEACRDADLAPVGDALLGRAVDPLGRPIDRGGAIRGHSCVPLTRAATAPLD